MEVISCNGKAYYLEEDLKEADKAYFYGCSRARSIIEKKSIPETEYVFAILRKKTNEWEVKSREYKPAKLLVSRKWAHHFVPVLRPMNKEDNNSSEENEQTTISMDSEENVYKIAPPILELEEEERFRDKDGNILDIEVRGERNYKNCYFLVKDISKVFEIPLLYKSLTNDRSYERFIHFETFIRLQSINDGSHTIEKNTKSLYLTYNGVLKVLFSSRSGNAENFQDWATEKLFTIQMGSKDDKNELASTLLGVSPEIVQRFLDCCVRDLALVYLIRLGSVPDDMDLDGNKDDYCLLKPGMHKNDTRTGFIGRSKGHQREFKEFKKEMRYINFLFVDPQYVCEVEKEIKDFLKEYKCEYKNKAEVFLIPKQKIESIQYFLKEMAYKYSGNAYDIQKEFDKFKHQTDLLVKDQKNQIIHLEKQIEYQKKIENNYQCMIQQWEERYRDMKNSLDHTIQENRNIIQSLLGCIPKCS